jgi:anti-sigma regulatory factor (Ser/Thr protein kinase)
VITRQEIRAVLADGGRLIDLAGRPLGRMVDVVLDAATYEPTWVTVDCPTCTGDEVVVPLARARMLDAFVQVPYTAAAICGAPRGSAGRLDRRREEELRRYYADLHDVDRGIVPSIAGLDVRTGNGDPAAYPATLSGPWLPVATSSAGPPWWQRLQWRWPSQPASLRAMRVELRPVLDLTGLPEDDVDDLVLAAAEAAMNAIEHARGPDLPFFDVSTEVSDHWARITIQDHGRWRTPSAEGDRGRGLSMIGVLADATLTVGSRGTTVVLRNRNGAADDRIPPCSTGRAT